MKLKIIEAVAGAGKTSLIAAVISKKISEGIDPGLIYAVTFTREAADELRSRTSPGVNSSTIHSLAYRLVYKNDIPDTEYGDFRYDDLLNDAIKYLSCIDVRDNVSYGLLAVDEAQDLTPVQYSFLAAFARHTDEVIIVGDKMQSIYGFSGSDPDIMNRFATLTDDIIYDYLSSTVRLPSLVTDYINSCFQPGVKISTLSSDPGVFRFIKSSRKSMYNDAAATVIPGENQAVLFRTNREVLNFVKRSDISDKVSAVLPMSFNPYVGMMRTIARLNTGISLHELIDMSWMVGGFTWHTRNVLNMFQGYVVNREQINNVFHPMNHSIKIEELPPILPSSRNEVYHLIQELDAFSKYYSAKSTDELSALYNDLKERAYNVDVFWRESSIKDEDIVNAAHKLISTGTESYISTNQDATVRVMTMHSSKGREFDNVTCVINGSVVNLYEKEEFRVLYVACTRTRKILNVISPVDVTRNKDKRNIIDSLDPEEDIL